MKKKDTFEDFNVDCRNYEFIFENSNELTTEIKNILILTHFQDSH